MIHALVVFWKLIIDSVQRKLTHADPISMTPNQRAEITWVADVIVEPFIAEHDVAQSAVAIRYLERRDCAAIRHDRDFNAAVIRERVKIHLPTNIQTRGHRAEVLFGYLHRLLKTRFASSSVSAEPTSYQRPGTSH